MVTTTAHPGVLADVLERRRWIRRSEPFPHVIAYDVFRPEVYRRIEEAFTAVLESVNGQPYLQEHDIQGRNLDADIAGLFDPLVTRPWHDLLAHVLGIPATGQVACGLHHHRVRSKDGFPHNDLNPGWFGEEARPGGLTISGPDVHYTTGRSLNGKQPIEAIRAAAVLYYVANPPWEPGDGGATGLYRSAKDPIQHPVGAIPPINNSMFMFECTPQSFHGFIGNRRKPRNSIIMWLHRPKADVVRRWGEHAIVPYGGHKADGKAR
jgi:hypothetical protein